MKNTADNLVIFNAVGKTSNLELVKHSRKTSFIKDEWDCVVFMYAFEDSIPEDHEILKALRDELDCSIPRMPGVMWGNFLQFITPTFADNYDYVALILDDVFLPDRGDHKVDPGKLIEEMKANKIAVMSPGIVSDTYKFSDIARAQGLHEDIVEVQFIETYVQFFTRESWSCFYNMLHYSGSRGWCYDMCLKQKCPEARLGIDFSMRALHIDRSLTTLPADLVAGTDLENWKYEPNKPNQGYTQTNALAICARYGCSGMNENMKVMKWVAARILVPKDLPAQKEIQ